MSEVWTIQSALNWCQGYLERHGDENPRLSAQWLLSFATGLSRIEVYTHFDQPLSLDERDVLRDAVRRRGAGEPLQYIQNAAPFRYLMLYVEPGVLIPRPETEILVDEALKLCHEWDEETVNVVDCCTGSGCIACSIATELPSTQVIATDISPEALKVARRNVADLQIGERVDVQESDLFACIESDSVHVIASNPPYVPTAVMQELPDEVAQFEPELALEGGADGLDIFRRMLPEMNRVLHAGGSFICELHETCLNDAVALAEAAGFVRTRIVKDLTDRPRFIVAYKENIQ